MSHYSDRHLEAPLDPPEEPTPDYKCELCGGAAYEGGSSVGYLCKDCNDAICNLCNCARVTSPVEQHKLAEAILFHLAEPSDG